MKKLNLLSLLFIASTIVGCHNTTTKNTTTDAGSSNEETQEAVGYQQIRSKRPVPADPVLMDSVNAKSR